MAEVLDDQSLFFSTVSTVSISEMSFSRSLMRSLIIAVTLPFDSLFL